MKEIPLSVPNLNSEIADYLRECVETGWVSTGGRFITEFEEKVAAYTGVSGAVGCQSGTAGLHTALRILGVGAGDIVVCPTLTFIAAINPVRYLDADPVFIDCGADLCMDPAKLERYLREDCHIDRGGDGADGTADDKAERTTIGNAANCSRAAAATTSDGIVRPLIDSATDCSRAAAATSDGIARPLIDNATGRAVKAIAVVHVFGVIADMERIMDIAAAYGLPVIEDATEAMGSFVRSGRFDGRHAGTMGDIGVFSFNANKIITTGGGGMIVAGGGGPTSIGRRARAYLDEARYLTTTAKDDGLYFEHGEVGYNYRMLNLQAALGVSQIDELEKFVGTKHRNYELYAQLLGGAPGATLLPPPEGQRWNHWFYSLYIEDDPASPGSPNSSSSPGSPAPQSGARRDRLMKALIAEGIQCRPVWKLVHTQKPYKEFRATDIEQAYDYEKHILNLPCSTNLTEDDVRYVSNKILDLITDI